MNLGLNRPDYEQTGSQLQEFTPAGGAAMVTSEQQRRQRMNIITPAVYLAAFMPILAAQTPPPKTFLKAGDKAPDFTLPSTPSGKPVKLSGFRGQYPVVLAFFPAAFTGG